MRLHRRRQAGSVREAARQHRRRLPAGDRRRGGGRPAAREPRLHAPLRPGLRGDQGEPRPRRRRRGAARPLRPPQRRRPGRLHLGDADHQLGRPRDRRHALAARRGDRRRDRACPAAVQPGAPGPARPAARAAGDRERRADRRRGVRQRALRLRHPLRARRRDRHAAPRRAGRARLPRPLRHRLPPGARGMGPRGRERPRRRPARRVGRLRGQRGRRRVPRLARLRRRAAVELAQRPPLYG